MARRRRRSNNRQRVVSTPNSNRRLSGVVRRRRWPDAVTLRRLSDLRQLEDRRTYHPEGTARPARGFRINRHRLIISAPEPTPGRGVDLHHPEAVPIGVGFEKPRQVAVCIRRHQRREVLHALGKTGRGSRFNRKPRKSFYSEVSCK